MHPGWAKSIVGGLGPAFGDLPSTQTAPLGAAGISAQGILNLPTLGTTAVLIVQGGQNLGKLRRVKIVTVTAARDVAWKHVKTGSTAPTVTAASAGGANEGSLLMGGGGATEEFTLTDNVDLYLVASAAATVVNITVQEI